MDKLSELQAEAKEDLIIPDDENLALGAMELSGSATGTKSMNIDYIFAAQNRL